MTIFKWFRIGLSCRCYNKYLNSISDCCEQAEKTEEKQVDKLLEILEHADDSKLPDFYDILIETQQRHILNIILKRNGLQHAS